MTTISFQKLDELKKLSKLSITATSFLGDSVFSKKSKKFELKASEEVLDSTFDARRIDRVFSILVQSFFRQLPLELKVLHIND